MSNQQSGSRQLRKIVTYYERLNVCVIDSGRVGISVSCGYETRNRGNPRPQTVYDIITDLDTITTNTRELRSFSNIHCLRHTRPPNISTALICFTCDQKNVFILIKRLNLFLPVVEPPFLSRLKPAFRSKRFFRDPNSPITKTTRIKQPMSFVDPAYALFNEK